MARDPTLLEPILYGLRVILELDKEETGPRVEAARAIAVVWQPNEADVLAQRECASIGDDGRDRAARPSLSCKRQVDVDLAVVRKSTRILARDARAISRECVRPFIGPRERSRDVVPVADHEVGRTDQQSPTFFGDDRQR